MYGLLLINKYEHVDDSKRLYLMYMQNMYLRNCLIDIKYN
jgi:hypothetical protein